MNGIRDMFETVANYKLLDVEVGAGLTLAVGDALATAISDAMYGLVKLPPIVSDFAVAYLDKRFNVTDRFLGPHTGFLFRSILVKRGIDNQFALTQTIHNVIANVLSKLGLGGGTAPATPAPSGGTSGFEEIGNIEPIGELEIGEAPASLSTPADVATILEAREKFFEAVGE